MLELIIQYFNFLLAQSNLFERTYELCEFVVDENENKTVKLYKENGDYENAQKIDKYRGMSYWRNVGDVSITSNNETNNPSCDNEVNVNYKLRLVTFISKKDCIDNNYKQHTIADKIIKILNANKSYLRHQIGAKRIVANVESFKTDINDIVNDEFQDLKTITNKGILLSFEINVNVLIARSCINDYCTSTLELFKVVKIYDGNGNLIQEVPCGGEYICEGASGDNVIIKNSNNTFNTTVQCGNTYTLPNTTVDVYVDSIFQQTTTFATLDNETININWT